MMQCVQGALSCRIFLKIYKSLLCSYIHASPLLESSSAFESLEAAEKTAAALGRILLLDLVIRNEDRLPCRELRWRGNSANLLLADKMASANIDGMEEAFGTVFDRYRPRVSHPIQKERRSTSVDSSVSPHSPGLVSQSSELSDVIESPKSSNMSLKSQSSIDLMPDLHIVAIDTGVPRRPPARKRANDRTMYPKFVELLINSSEYSSNILNEVSGGKLGSPSDDTGTVSDLLISDMTSVVRCFRSGFRAAVRDLQGFHIFLLTLHQKLDCLLRAFLIIINKTSPEYEKEETVIPSSPSKAVGGGVHSPSSPGKEHIMNYNHLDSNDTELEKSAPRSSLLNCKESPDSISPASRDGSHGKFNKGSSEPLRSQRLTAKIRDFHKFAKVFLTHLCYIIICTSVYLFYKMIG